MIGAKGDPDTDHNKKRYKAPELIVHGGLKKITRRGGGDRIDVPEGTAAAPATVSSAPPVRSRAR